MRTMARLHAAGVALLLCAALTAEAASLQVSVLAADGKPLVDAVVVVEPLAPGSTRTPVPVPVQATIRQERMRFAPALTVVPVGSRVRFTNLDSYEHHVRGRPAGAVLLESNPGGSSFELRVGAATDGRAEVSQGVVVAEAGPLELSCHLHSVMRGHIFVAETPWVAKTDANGNATVTDLPEGAAQVRLWHGDQLLPSAPVAVNLGVTTTLALPTRVLPRGRSRR